MKDLAVLIRSHTMQLAKKVMHPNDRHAFTSVYTGTHILTQAGFFGFQSCCPFVPRLDVSTHLRVFKAFVSLHGGLGHGWGDKFDLGALLVAPRQWCLRAPPPWTRPQGLGIANRSGSTSEAFLIKCPAGCGSVVTMRAKPTREATSWPAVFCPSCKKRALWQRPVPSLQMPRHTVQLPPFPGPRARPG